MAQRKKDVTLGQANNYERSENFFDSLQQAFSDLKMALGQQNGMNLPVEDISGISMRWMNRNTIEIAQKKYIVGNAYQLNVKEKTHADEFLDQMVKELKAMFKKIAGTPLELKKIKQDQDLQLYSKLSGDRSWALGGSYGAAVGRYMITTSRIYQVDAKNLSDETEARRPY